MEPQRSSLSFDASLPGIIHSFEACDSVEQFPDMALRVLVRCSVPISSISSSAAGTTKAI